MIRAGRRMAAAVGACAALFALITGLQAAWIPLKAELAQGLLHRSWQHILAGDRDARPWPWADTRPAARLRVPALGIDQLVLAGQSGRNLAFGPVWLEAATAGQDRVISGHRDTHFRFVHYLSSGDIIWLDTPGWQRNTHPTAVYVVEYSEVIDSRGLELVLEPTRDRLSLVTCYPFDARPGGGPLRLVVTARPAVPADLRTKQRETSSG